MAVSAEYKEFLLDLLAPLGPLKIRAMFGGAGVYYKDVMFGLVAADTLYLKVDENNQSDFEQEDMKAFTYDGKGKSISMSYFEVPDRLLDETDELIIWAQKSVDAALRNAAKKPKKARRKRSARKKD